MNEILIRGLEITACHGVHGFEKVAPQPFVFDADIETDFYEAGKTDALDATVSYSDVCRLLDNITRGTVYNLIERLAYECAFAVMENFPRVNAVKLTVSKPSAPVNLKFSSVGVTVGMRRERVWLSLGSSMGDRQAYLDKAIKLLDETRGVRVVKVSDSIKTPPYGGTAVNEFLNCAALVETFLSPHNLLDEIHRIEEACGRVRKERWGDRTLDIDIILFGNKKICDERLTIPHPDCKNRDFVKIPLKQLGLDLN